MSESLPIICLDFDGVLHIGAPRWEGPAVIRGKLHPDALAWLGGALRYYRVAVYSARSATEEGRAAIRAWLDGQGAPVEMLEFPSVKPSARLFIDDRGWRFDGTFPELGPEGAPLTWEERERAKAWARVRARRGAV